MKTFKIRLLRLGIAGTLLSGLAGCAIDPRYAALESHIQTNPAPTAIEGMWHHKGSGTISMLFRSDGTLLYKSKLGAIDPKVAEWPYRYSGNGEWTIDNPPYRFKLANGFLILYGPGSRMVFERQ